MILLRHRLANSVSTYYVAKSLLYLTITILATRSSASSYESTLSFCDDETSTFAANYVSTEFNTSLSGLVETFQSWGGHTGAQQLKDIILNISSDELSSDNEQLQEYATDMVVFAVPGIVMFVLTFFFGIGMICARWCCPNSCCKPKKAINEYSWYVQRNSDPLLRLSRTLGYTSSFALSFSRALTYAATTIYIHAYRKTTVARDTGQ